MRAFSKKVWVWIVLGLTPLWLGLCVLAGPFGPLLTEWDASKGYRLLALLASRTLAGFVVGAGLACSGVVLQALLRNPLADPYVLGVSSGAGLGAALAIYCGWTAAGALALPGAAFVAAAATLALVYAVARQGGALSVYGLLLSGVIVGSMAASLLMLILSLVPVEGLHSITWWMLGNLQITSLPLLAACAALIAVGCAGIWLLARPLDVLTLGREMAHHVGVRAGLMAALGLTLATLTTAAAVGLAGLIGFVGLIVPHIVRGLLGPDHRRLIPASALAGGLFLAVCDALARALFAPIEVPVGVITALAGGPFFLILLRRRRRGGWVE